MSSENIDVMSSSEYLILSNMFSNSDILFLIAMISLSVIFNLLDKVVFILESLFEIFVTLFFNVLLSL